MRLTKFSHSCVRLEHDGGVLVIDPGQLSEPESLDGVDAVLITHEHFDHLDVEKLADALGKRPTIEVYTHPDVVAKLGDLAGSAKPVVAGDEFTAAGLHVRAYGGLHAIIHPELPRVANIGFFVEAAGGDGGVYHPGDSFDVPTDANVDTLFVPVAGPWMKLAEAVEFVRQVAPRRAYAIHEAVLSQTGFMVTDSNMKNLARTEYARLEPGQQIAV
ncbi:MBL fold metallo-hydrolase [Planosporangium flavigriseum]|uniref:MBL fold metallo-hydrolase n=1 Tax=Planosporangium flavigriseum TaxID=373681 RepID=A0A8J3PJD4_9ACTN|nr:MBL fold metallo-hydrolase [Planosporangium flavigriseum]NJC63484.1 MBL fold metallo-hydrolase [Planosporangium flavigriseum]GIG72181.1 MBL fold metallo-hydrolase [Planosporangium flavigriseum]